MSEIDFAPTTNGGRVRLSSVAHVNPPMEHYDGRWSVPVVIVGNSATIRIGFFTSESAAQRWVDANLPMRDLP